MALSVCLVSDVILAKTWSLSLPFCPYKTITLALFHIIYLPTLILHLLFKWTIHKQKVAECGHDVTVPTGHTYFQFVWRQWGWHFLKISLWDLVLRRHHCVKDAKHVFSIHPPCVVGKVPAE